MLALLTPFAVAASEPERAPAWALKQHHVTSASPMSGLFSPSVWDSDDGREGRRRSSGEESWSAFRRSLMRRVTLGTLNATFSEPRDWSAFEGIRLTVRASCSERSRRVTVRIILNVEEQMKLNGVPMPYGSERTLLLPFPAEKRGMLRDVRRLRFYLVSREFPDGARIWMQAGDFQLVKLREQRAGLPRGEAGLEMYFGDAGEVNILEEGRHPRARVRVHTGPDAR